MKGIKRCITLEGLNLERLLRQAGEKQIRLNKLRRSGRKCSAQVAEDQLDSLADLAEQGGWRLNIGSRSGMAGKFDVFGHRWPLCIFLLTGTVVLIISMQFMWHIDIHDAGIYTADLTAYLLEHQISPPMPKKTVNLEQLRDDLEWRYPDIAWAECGWRGVTLRITLSQGTPLGNAATHDGSGDVVAARAGIIESIVTIAGTPQVSAGDVVTQGQVLIKGQERTSNDGLRSVMARGTVLARVWDGASIRMPAHQTETEYTGQTEHVWSVTCPWFDLWKTPASEFEQYDIMCRNQSLGGLFFPFILQFQSRVEAKHRSVPVEETDLKASAGEAAMRMLRQKIGFDHELVDKWVDYCMIEDEVLEAVAIGERLIDIAQQVRNEP